MPTVIANIIVARSPEKSPAFIISKTTAAATISIFNQTAMFQSLN